MQDRTKPENWPNQRGPWYEVTDLSRLHDAGQIWCVNANGHPDPEGGYPDIQRHFPFDECRTRSYFVEDVRADLTGSPLDLELYGAKPFQFGWPRDTAPAGRPRLVLDILDVESPAGPFRLSLALGEALLLAQQLQYLVAQLDGL